MCCREQIEAPVVAAHQHGRHCGRRLADRGGRVRQAPEPWQGPVYAGRTYTCASSPRDAIAPPRIGDPFMSEPYPYNGRLSRWEEVALGLVIARVRGLH